jgi:hypothetical protein
MSVDEQHEGCEAHIFLPSLVNGEQIDACSEGTWVDYKMPDGSVWRNEVQG